MNLMGAKLRHRRQRLGLTLDDLAARTAISKPYLSLIETGRVANPPSDAKLRRLEQTLGFSPGELISQAHFLRTPSDVRAVLSELIAKSQSGERGVHGDVEQLATNAIPIINKVSAGYPTDFTDLSYPRGIADDYVTCPDLNDPQAFAARVHGDSMTPKYQEGDIVIFSPAAAVRTGDDCFIRFADGQTTFKRVYFEEGEQTQFDKIRLHPRNPQYPTQTFPREQITGMYRAVFRYEKI